MKPTAFLIRTLSAIDAAAKEGRFTSRHGSQMPCSRPITLDGSDPASAARTAQPEAAGS